MMPSVPRLFLSATLTLSNRVSIENAFSMKPVDYKMAQEDVSRPNLTICVRLLRVHCQKES